MFVHAYLRNYQLNLDHSFSPVRQTSPQNTMEEPLRGLGGGVGGAAVPHREPLGRDQVRRRKGGEDGLRGQAGRTAPSRGGQETGGRERFDRKLFTV